MNNLTIFYPVFAMVFLVFCVGCRLGYLRYWAVDKDKELGRFYIDYRGDAEPQNIRIASRHFINQFEVPLLFYVGTLVAYVTNQVGTILLSLAWLYVALRYLHSFIHLGKNNVLHRFSVFLFSVVVLNVFWLVLAISIVQAGTAE